MKKLLVILTNYRIAEKIIPIIPKLSESYELYFYMIGQFSTETIWYGNDDPRVRFMREYATYSNNFHVGPAFNASGYADELFKLCSATDFDGVICDDNRLLPELEIPHIFLEFKSKDIPVIGNSHGNQEFKTGHLSALGRSYDYVFLLGKKEKDVYSQAYDAEKLLLGGIPSNDVLGTMKRQNKHLLLIVNFLGNRAAPFSIKFDNNFIYETGVIDLAKRYQIPVLVKNKARHDDPDYKKNEDYVRNWFDVNDEYEIVTDGNNDQLIADARVVVSAPSTFAFKSIQMGIPTITIKNAGQTGNFYDFSGLVPLEKKKIWKELDEQFEKEKDIKFIENTIEGGVDFNSIDVYVNKVKSII